MTTFPLFKILQERYINLLPGDVDKKREIKDEVFAMLQQSYADQGGIAGSGFASAEDMVAKVPFWKVIRKNGKLVAVLMYKDTQGRKFVAIATDGSVDGKKAVGDAMIADLTQGRSYGEVSGKSLSFARKFFDITPYLIPYEKAESINAARGEEISRPTEGDPEVTRHPTLKQFFYVRQIGGEPHTKLMVGTPNISIY